MLKLFGAALITLSCSAIGFSLNAELKARVASLKSLLGALHVIRAEIVFRASPLPDIVATLAQECDGLAKALFVRVGSRMTAGQVSFFQAFTESLTPKTAKGLLASDVECLTEAARMLGRYDAPTQSQSLAASIDRLERLLAQATEDQSQKGKLYRAVGLTAGVMIALVAI